ncbi:hypothetical protein FRB94_010535 [Tulasnella sp. JGI-2019a]|nr:hypothetical protein FRB94_010535 [Tulasnella sp. JGI-2019a]KAG9017913.1 hypothetical protein FRB93_004724 [Tulasnella sp. JGI-2019a]KAG9039064.1 hypothetical protein FRB95_012775 [Tulasnella sp. JGI-2019a]
MFRHVISRPLAQAVRRQSTMAKQTTGITGLNVHADPLPALQSTLKDTLALLASIPSSSVYRQGSEATIKNNLSIIEAAKGDVMAVENQLSLGQIEEVLQSAKAELNLVGKMIEWKAWEPLEEQPPPNQWEYFKE